MPKARMSALDVRAMVSCLSPSVQKLRVSNIYDISSKVYVLKLSEQEESQKKYLLLEAGVRFHLSQWKRDKQAIPSVFTMNLRRHIRTKRLVSLTQLGGDRVIDIQFGLEEHAIHLIVEFYARGNVVLTDAQYCVIASWRQQRCEADYAVKIKSKYPLERYLQPTTFAIYPPNAIESADAQAIFQSASPLFAALKAKSLELADSNQTKKKGSKQTKSPGSVLLHDLLLEMHPASHSALIHEICEETKNKIPQEYDSGALPKPDDLYLACKLLHDRWALANGPTVPGYLYSKLSDQSNKLVRESFSPIPLGHHDPNWTMESFDSFSDAVDIYFTEADLQKDEKAQVARKHELEGKVDKIRHDQTERVNKLIKERDTAEACAVRVEHYLVFVAQLLEMLQRLVNSGADWQTIDAAVKERRRSGHPLASFIQKLDLKANTVTVLLPHPDIGLDLNQIDGKGEAEDDLLAVPLLISDGVFNNVKRLHSEKKACDQKCEKTKAAAEAVIAKAEKTVQAEQARRQVAVSKPSIQRVRKVFWFEKFHWFISSDNYLVLAGKDALQNEILYRKYLTKHDLYVHADVHGAATCIIRNPNGGPVPQKTIDEAGIMAVCRSNAWKTKVIANAYWVYAHQVSKTPQAGEYVSTGGFIIRGKRNLILVKKLEVGIGILFHLGDDESKARHAKDHAIDCDFRTPQNPESLLKMNLDSAHTELEPSHTDLDPTQTIQSIDLLKECPLSESVALGETLTETTPPQTTEERRNSVFSRRSSVKSSGSRVQFGNFEILPTTSIEAKVDFVNLPPEVILVQANKSILSEDEDNDECNIDDCNFDESVHSYSSQSIRKDLRRPDSADELPPPPDYLGRSSPRDLLAKRTPETEELTPKSEEEDDCQEDTPSHCDAQHGWPQQIQIRSESSGIVARDPVDGGPIPRGFLSRELPPPKDLLRSGSESLRRLSQNSLGDSAPPITMDSCIRKGMSKALRRRLKKGGAPVTTRSDAGESTSADNKIVEPKKTLTHLSKRQQYKMKKIKQKYEEQSEDERDEAMQLIGARKMKFEIEENDPKDTVEDDAKKMYWDKTVKREAVPDRNFEDEDSDLDKDEWQKRLDALGELCGRPLDNDLLTMALPVCAPFSALQNYLYRGKLLPGGGKKGQAVQIAHRALLELAPVDSINRQLIRQITADEFSAAMTASPIVQIEGASRIQKQERKALQKLKKATKA